MSDNGVGDRSATHLASVEVSDIPPYLQGSEFFLSLLEDGENDCIPVPKECMKNDDSVNSRDDLRSLLLTLRFWVTDGISDSVLDFAMSQPFESYEDILSEFYKDLPILRNIQMFKLSLTPMIPAIGSGILDFVKYFCKRGHPWPDRTCDIICKSGNAVMLEYAIENECAITEGATVIAAGEGHITCLQLLHANNAPWDAKTTTAAAKGGHVDCLKYAHENGCPWLCSEDESDVGYLFETSDDESDYGSSEDSSYAEGDNEHDDQVENENEHDEDVDSDADSVPILEMHTADGFDEGVDVASFNSADHVPVHSPPICYDQRVEDSMNNICTIAAANGSVACLQYAHNKGVVLQPMAIKAAARHHQGLECLKYLYQQGLPLTISLTFNAAYNGNLEMLRYMHAHDCPWDARTSCAAASRTGKNNQTACTVVLYLLRNGCAPSNDIWNFTGIEFHRILQCFLEVGLAWSATPKATLRAARVNNLEGLKCLVEKGCPWDEFTTSEAVRNVEMLTYVHKNGCPWTHETCIRAALLGWLECLEYAHTHGARISVNTCVNMMHAYPGCAKRVSLECCIECPLLPRFTSYCARSGRLDLLKYLHENGCPMEDRAAAIASQNGHAECLEYILGHGGIHSDIVYEAAKAKKHESCMLVAEKFASSAPSRDLPEK